LNQQIKDFVDLDRVSLRYGEDGDGTLALRGATLRVAPAEFVAVARNLKLLPFLSVLRRLA